MLATLFISISGDSCWAAGEIVNQFDHSATVKPILFRTWKVDPDNDSLAFDLLGPHDFIALSNNQVRRLLHRLPTYEETLDKEISATNAHAAEAEKLAEQPFFSGRRSVLQQDAKLHREHSMYLAGIANRLRPYLVKAKACYRNRDYIVTVDLDQHLLMVKNDCPGRGPVAVIRVPIVIFVETNIESVILDIAAYE